MSSNALRCTIVAALLTACGARSPSDAGPDGQACGAVNQVCCYNMLCDDGLICLRQACAASSGGSSATGISGSSGGSGGSTSSGASGTGSSSSSTEATSASSGPGSTAETSSSTRGSSGSTGSGSAGSTASTTSGAGGTGATSSATSGGLTSGSPSGSSSGGSVTGTSAASSSETTAGSSSASSSGTGSSSGGLLDGGAFVTIPLSGCPLIGFSTPVTIATQPFQLSVDTGSTDTGVALSICSNCGVAPEYSPSVGTCSGNTASSYGVGSWTADVCSGLVTVGAEFPGVTIDFAGITNQTQFFINYDCSGNYGPAQSQGILGLGPIDLDTIGTYSADAFFNELVQQGVTDTFAVLLCSLDGELWFGGYDAQYASGPPQYTPMSASSYWAVNLQSVGFGTQNLGGGNGQSIVDTGTWGFYLASSAFNLLVSSVGSDTGTKAIFGSLNPTFFTGSSCALPASGQSATQIDSTMQPLTLTFSAIDGGSFTLSLPATQSYLLPVTSGGTTEYCFGVADSSQINGQTIIGAAALRTNITVFDEGHKQVGFVPQAYCQ